MKKAYVKPSMESEEFVPSEYVAACSGGATYVGRCDISGSVYIDGDGDGILTSGKGSRDSYKYANTACGRLYESDQKPTFNAFVMQGDWEAIEYETEYIFGIPVRVPVKWQAKDAIRVFNYNDVHVTQNIDTNIYYNVSV